MCQSAEINDIRKEQINRIIYGMRQAAANFAAGIMFAEFCVSAHFFEGELLQYRPFLKALFCGQPF